MKHLQITFLSLLVSISCSFAQAPSHAGWNTILQKYVSSDGRVDYQGIKNNRSQLDAYLALLSKTPPPPSGWSKADIMAYWINAYNAFTIDLILDHYPLKSINDISKDGKKPWDIPFIKIGGKAYTLNHIEHEILRKKYADPRIHFAVNCASYSCPPILNKAFTGSNLDREMTALAKRFINDKNRNKISAQSIQVSQIFEWFSGDFTKKGSLIDFLNKYSSTPIAASAKISYLDYNWSLNQ